MEMKKGAVHQESLERSLIRHIATACITLILTSLLSACGGGSSTPASSTPNPTPTPTPSVSKTAVQVNIGDSPADEMLAFSMNIGSMSLTESNGPVSVISSATAVEMMHLTGMMQPLAMVSVPQGSYTGASVNISSATAVYMDPVSKGPVQKTISGPITATITFNSPITVGSTPMAMGFDLNLAKSLTMDASGNLTMNPDFQVTSGGDGSGNPLDPADGRIQQMMGAVSGVSGSSFTMTSLQWAQPLTFETNSSTVFDNTSLSMMANGMLMLVDASLQSDGSLMATKVQSMINSGGVMGEGIVATVTGQPATQLTMIMQGGVGTGMMSSMFAAGITVDLNGSTTYQMDYDNMDMSDLPFTPTFDSNHVYPGQSVMPISSGGMMNGGMGTMMGGNAMAGTITASAVALMPEGLSGTASSSITSGMRSSFTLTLPSDSAFATLNRATTVIVYQQPETMVASASPIGSGTMVHAFGLLFFDSGQWKMVVSRVSSD
jgi:hypothetical protein